MRWRRRRAWRRHRSSRTLWVSSALTPGPIGFSSGDFVPGSKRLPVSAYRTVARVGIMRNNFLGWPTRSQNRKVPTAIWTGSLSLGLVVVPVRLYRAVKKKNVRFHELDGGGHRVRHVRVPEPDFEPEVFRLPADSPLPRGERTRERFPPPFGGRVRERGRSRDRLRGDPQGL